MANNRIGIVYEEEGEKEKKKLGCLISKKKKGGVTDEKISSCRANAQSEKRIHSSPLQKAKQVAWRSCGPKSKMCPEIQNCHWASFSSVSSVPMLKGKRGLNDRKHVFWHEYEVGLPPPVVYLSKRKLKLAWPIPNIYSVTVKETGDSEGSRANQVWEHPAFQTPPKPTFKVPFGDRGSSGQKSCK